MTIQINTSSVVNLLNVGDEHTPVIYIDDFLVSLEPLKEYAIETAEFYQEPKSSYPGVRAEFPQAFLERMTPIIAQPIRQIFQIPKVTVSMLHAAIIHWLAAPLIPCVPCKKSPMPTVQGWETLR